MMLFDPKVSPSIKWRIELVNVNWRPEKGHFFPEVKAANERASYYEWGKLYATHFCNLLSMVYKECPVILGTQTLYSSPLSSCRFAQ
jgi:hypothetical protein